ncbi:MAG: hypothetical protein KF716_08170 [Anaerolineae bacterium]|nr:hypothetical protein [Anaerolineae bacterium]
MRTLNGQDRPREQKPQRANVLTSGQRFSVRLALATGATLAALLGVQTLALQDQSVSAAQTASVVTTSDDQASVVTNGSSTTIQATEQPATSVTIYTTSSQPRPSTRSSR